MSIRNIKSTPTYNLMINTTIRNIKSKNVTFKVKSEISKSVLDEAGLSNANLDLYLGKQFSEGVVYEEILDENGVISKLLWVRHPNIKYAFLLSMVDIKDINFD